MTRLWPQSLFARILLAEAIVIFIVAILLPVLTINILHRTTARYQNRELVAQARIIARAVKFDTGGVLVVQLTAEQAALYATGYDGRAFVVVGIDGVMLAASRFARSLPWQTAPRSAELSTFRSNQIVGVSQPVSILGRSAWVIVSQDENGPGAIVDDVSRSFLRHYLEILLPILLVLPLVNSIAIKRSVIGVRRASNAAACMGSKTLHERLDETGVPKEVVPLVEAMNRLLARLEESFREQGEFVANVAHELRTPLATLQVRLDSVEDVTVRALLEKQVDRMSHVLTQLRDLASLERLDTNEMDALDLTNLAVDLVSEVAPRVIARAQQIELRHPELEVEVMGNRALVSMALMNLINNAIEHTPAGTSIVVSVNDIGSISVKDDGPGIAEADPESVVRRFWRADTARSDRAGIGLSIVQRIVDELGGELLIRIRDPGVEFEMKLNLSN